MTKKDLVLIPFILFLTTCSSLPNNVASNFTVAFNSIQAAIFGFEDYPISRDLVSNIPYASLILKIGKGPAGLLILESKKDGLNTWVSADDVSIIEKGGKIVRTIGLTNNVVGLRSLQEKTFMDLITLTPSNKIINTDYLSLDNPEVFEMELDCYVLIEGKEVIEILDKKFSLIHISRVKENKFLRWKVKDHFWVDPIDGFVWKSIQNLAPNLPPVLIEVTKRPAN